jgi:hypothetical protein
MRGRDVKTMTILIYLTFVALVWGLAYYLIGKW